MLEVSVLTRQDLSYPAVGFLSPMCINQWCGILVAIACAQLPPTAPWLHIGVSVRQDCHTAWSNGLIREWIWGTRHGTFHLGVTLYLPYCNCHLILPSREKRQKKAICKYVLFCHKNHIVMFFHLSALWAGRVLSSRFSGAGGQVDGPDLTEYICLKPLDRFSLFDVLWNCVHLQPRGHLPHWGLLVRSGSRGVQTWWNVYLLKSLGQIVSIRSSMELSSPVVVQHHVIWPFVPYWLSSG